MDLKIMFMNNELIEIPMSLIPNKDKITVINFTNNKIKEIPRNINAFTSLFHLILCSNLIEVVPKEL